MKVELQINNSPSPAARFVSWAPSPCRLRVSDPTGATTPIVNITLSGTATVGGGAVVFRANNSGNFTNTLPLAVPTTGASVSFFVAGKFGRPSSDIDDTRIEARNGAALVGSENLMVRVRKNANTLTAAERDRFISAMAKLNNQGAGRFTDFRDMHTAVSSPQAHGAAGFLPWHRTYLLDLERELQAIDPSVTLPYWRFDQAAPNVFTPEFIGVSTILGNVQFSNANPLQFWKTDNIQGVTRRPLNNWNPGAQPAPGVATETQTLALGSLYADFRSMEGNPHGSAHVSFGGFISSIPSAARDPLFFLLHCNVDRLWAKWQRRFGRFDTAKTASYDSNPGNPVGHNLTDTMWPWNGITGGGRPPTAPGGPLAVSPCVSAPGPQPQVLSALDYQGSISALSREGFDYDDVRFA